MEKDNKGCVLQIKVTQEERAFIEKFLLRKSLLDAKRHSMSAFLSMSLMDKLNDDYEKLIKGMKDG